MEAMTHIKSDLASRLALLQKEKKKGSKIIGYLPGGYFPEELVLAAGAIPLGMIRGGEHAAVEASIAYVDRWLDTFYRAQSRDSETYVKVGDYVEKGQVLCIVEAMKLMNEIESEVAGTIVRILVQNAQPVEFNQKLFLVRPD